MPLAFDAPIREVTVFTDRARISRVGKIQLPKGEAVLLLGGLSNSLESDSVRVNGKGAGITIRGVDVRMDILAESTDELKAELQAEAKNLKNTLRELEHERSINDAELSYYQYLQNYSGASFGENLIKETLSFERISDTIKFIREELAACYSRRREMEARWQDVSTKLSEVEHRLKHDKTGVVKRGQAVYVAVEAEESTELELELEYLVKNAAWRPLYDIRLLESNEIELSYLAEISQTTEEDWRDVSLSLSTARPARSKILPSAQSWYIESYEPLARAREAGQERRGSPVGARYEAAPRAPQEAPVPKPQAKIQQAAVQAASSGIFVTYKVGTPLTILGNGEPHKTTVTITKLKTELDYLTVPRVAEEAYLRAKITNDSAYTILKGEASIFHGNDFVAKSALATIAPNEEFQIHLGVDERIKVERKLMKRESSSRLMGSVSQLEYRYAISLMNLQEKAVKIRVEEAYPLSKNSQIKVSLDSVNPPPKAESELHILSWELELAGEEKRLIEIAFSIEYGRNQLVEGLDD